MAGSVYVASGEYAGLGLPSSTSTAQVIAAGVLIDAHLGRPEGLVWTPDASGAPCFMAALTPSLTLQATAGISPGSNVVVPVTGFIYPDLVGEVLILDRGVSGKTEAVVVSAIGQATVTLQSVAVAHSSGAVAEGGLVITEERALPANRSVARINRTHPARMLAVQGRYAYGRRSQQQAGIYAEPSIVTAVQVFGGPPAWNPVDVAHVSVSPVTGEVWVPAGALNAAFSEVRMRYVAGFSAANLPQAVKVACATIVVQQQNFPELSGSIKAFQAGGSRIERFADSMLDEQTRRELEAFKVRGFV